MSVQKLYAAFKISDTFRQVSTYLFSKAAALAFSTMDSEPSALDGGRLNIFAQGHSGEPLKGTLKDRFSHFSKRS